MTTKPVTDAEVKRFQNIQQLAGLEDALDDLLQSRAVEAVGAVPVGEVLAADAVATMYIALPPGTKLYTAPPSSKDDLAGAGVFRGPAKWTDEELADGKKGIRWIREDGVHGRPTSHDVMDYLERRGQDAFCSCEKCRVYFASQPKAPAPVVAQGEAIRGSEEDAIWAIIFDDHERRHEILWGERVARHRFEQISGNWNAHLFVKVESNCRDDRHVNDNIKFATPPGGAGGDVADEITPEMWSAGRREFIKYANKYEDAPTADRASVWADVAGADIYRAMRSARPAAEQANPVNLGSGGGAPTDAERYRALKADMQRPSENLLVFFDDEQGNLDPVEVSELDARLDAILSSTVGRVE